MKVNLELELNEEFKLLYKLIHEYWKDTPDAEDGTIDLNESYDEWLSEYLYDLSREYKDNVEGIKKSIRFSILTYIKDMQEV